MSIDMYELSVLYFSRGLKGVRHALERGAAHVAEHGLDPRTLLDARLYEDMFTFTRQVQTACDNARRASGRLAQAELASVPDEETTFAELIERVDSTLAFLETLDRDAISKSDTIPIELNLPGRTMHFDGKGYLLGFALPNFMFHASMAYAALRNQGVALGKVDFIASYSVPMLANR